MSKSLIIDIGDLTQDQQRDILFMVNACRVRNSPRLRQELADRYWAEVIGRIDSPGVMPLEDPPEDAAYLDRSRWDDK